MATTTDYAHEGAVQSAQCAVVVSFCPKCFEIKLFDRGEGSFEWEHCNTRWRIEPTANCPVCGGTVTFRWENNCPYCSRSLGDAIPMFPIPAKRSLLDSIVPSLKHELELQRERTAAEFRALHASWCRDCTSVSQMPSLDGTRFSARLRRVLDNHEMLLRRFQDDVDKFLYKVPIKLAKYEAEYSWHFDEALDKEIDGLLRGILSDCRSVANSPEFLARCDLQTVYSRAFLVAEIKRRFHEARVKPRQGFQLTLDYARSLDGVGFEEWLIKLLRDAAIPGVTSTQASHDQGADIVVNLGDRKLVLQAKNYKDTLGNGAVQEAIAARHFYSANEAWVVTTSTFSKDAIDLAYRTGVMLVDGSRLLNLPELILGGASASSTDDLPPPLQFEVPLASPLPTLSESAPSSTAAASNTVAPSSTAAAGTGSVSLAQPVARSNKKLIIFASLMMTVLLAVFGIVSSSQRGQTEAEIQKALERYQIAIRARNAQWVTDCYASKVERFYLARNVPKVIVLSEFTKDFATFTTIDKLEISSVRFGHLSGTRATVTFDREWSFHGVKDSAGKVQKEMVFEKADGVWLIVSDRDLRLYWSQPQKVLRSQRP